MKLERFKEKKKINKVIIGLSILLLIISGYAITLTFAQFKVETDKIPFINGKVKYSGGANGDVTFAFYVDDVSETTMPKKDTGYVYDGEKSNCDKNATIEWDNAKWAPLIVNLNEAKTKCELHFNKRPTFADDILMADQPNATDVADAKAKIHGKGTPSFSSNATTDMGLYETDDDLGKSYYFRGNVQDNWVSFANLYWRIIRINGDGTVRMIYNGKSVNQTAGTQTTTQRFNNSYSDPIHVGYKYGTYDSTKKIYNNTTNSTIKAYLESTWFTGALGSFTTYLADGIFCNDRTIIKHNGTAGNGSNGDNYYGPYERITNNNPSLQCPNENDRFAMGTNVGSVKTNGQIAQGKPVGLITADEVMMAGGTTSGGNSSFYLYTSSTYWTMSPSYFNSSGSARGWSVYAEGSLDVNSNMGGIYGVRPVINLKSDVFVSKGSGGVNDPYVIQTT